MRALSLYALLAFSLVACVTHPKVAEIPHGAIRGAALPPTNYCPTKEQLCPAAGAVEKTRDPPPDLSYSLTVRYCDKPIVVWARLKSDAKGPIPDNIVMFSAENTPPTTQFPKAKDFIDWLAAAPSQTYDLPCVGEKQRPIDSWPGGNDPGQAK